MHVDVSLYSILTVAIELGRGISFTACSKCHRYAPEQGGPSLAEFSKVLDIDRTSSPTLESPDSGKQPDSCLEEFVRRATMLRGLQETKHQGRNSPPRQILVTSSPAWQLAWKGPPSLETPGNSSESQGNSWKSCQQVISSSERPQVWEFVASTRLVARKKLVTWKVVRLPGNSWETAVSS